MLAELKENWPVFIVCIVFWLIASYGLGYSTETYLLFLTSTGPAIFVITIITLIIYFAMPPIGNAIDAGWTKRKETKEKEAEEKEAAQAQQPAATSVNPDLIGAD